MVDVVVLAVDKGKNKGAPMEKIDRTAYRELDSILWDIHDRFIKPQTAFEMYEKRWRFVEQEKISRKEKLLIQQLVDDFGNGLFMPAV